MKAKQAQRKNLNGFSHWFVTNKTRRSVARQKELKVNRSQLMGGNKVAPINHVIFAVGFTVSLAVQITAHSH